MDRAPTLATSPELLAARLARAVTAVCEPGLDLADPERLVLDLTLLEEDVDTWKSTVEVLIKHLHAA